MLRFGFGKNWQRFLKCVDDARIAEGEKSLCSMLDISDLRKKSFLDVGCGSGLFSLAAMRAGAVRVHSFDCDPQSVICMRTRVGKRRYFSGASNWTIQEADALDATYLSSLGKFDVVYSWGVLHHSGNMWRGLENLVPLVAPGGKLFIAMYTTTKAPSHIFGDQLRNGTTAELRGVWQLSRFLVRTLWAKALSQIF